VPFRTSSNSHLKAHARSLPVQKTGLHPPKRARRATRGALTRKETAMETHCSPMARLCPNRRSCLRARGSNKMRLLCPRPHSSRPKPPTTSPPNSPPASTSSPDHSNRSMSCQKFKQAGPINHSSTLCQCSKTYSDKRTISTQESCSTERSSTLKIQLSRPRSLEAEQAGSMLTQSSMH
jgi:hypothetical protein